MYMVQSFQGSGLPTSSERHLLDSNHWTRTAQILHRHAIPTTYQVLFFCISEKPRTCFTRIPSSQSEKPPNTASLLHQGAVGGTWWQAIRSSFCYQSKGLGRWKDLVDVVVGFCWTSLFDIANPFFCLIFKSVSMLHLNWNIQSVKSVWLSSLVSWVVSHFSTSWLNTKLSKYVLKNIASFIWSYTATP